MAKENFIKKSFRTNPVTSTVVTAAVLFGVGLTIKRAWGGGRHGRPPKIIRDVEELKNTWTPNPLAQKLYQQMKGVNLFPATESWKALYELPHDQQVVDVYNTFNAMYYPESGETLTQWIRGEYSDWEGNQAKVLKRLEALNLAEQSINQWL